MNAFINKGAILLASSWVNASIISTPSGIGAPGNNCCTPTVGAIHGGCGGSGIYTPLSGKYKLNPVLHSYYSINSDPLTNALNTTDNGSYYVSQQTNTGYLLVEFIGWSASTKIKE